MSITNKKQIKQPDNLNNWIENSLKLINLEHKEEIQQNKDLRTNNKIHDLEIAGHAITDMIIKGERCQYGAKVIIMVQNENKKNPADFIKSKLLRGCVGITIDDQTEPIAIGYALKIEKNCLEIDCDKDLTKIKCENFNLVKVVNDIEYNRIKFTLSKMVSNSQINPLIPLLFDSKPIVRTFQELQPYSSFLRLPYSGTESIVWFNKTLNESQKDAVQFSLYQERLGIIHGPPGTGKTTTLTELILQFVTRGQKVLVCAPSNVAVDNIFKQLIDSHNRNLCSRYGKIDFKFVRVGHPVRIDDKIKKYALIQSYGPKKSGKSNFEVKILKKRLREANVIMSTLCSSAIHDGLLKYLYDDILDFAFDIVIIDECAQATEPLAWIPLSYARKCILAGDHKQLPPTIFSLEAAEKGLNVSLLERAIGLFGNDVVRMLNVQHRMNEIIMNWPSDQFYNGQLKAANSVAFSRLTLKGTRKELPPIRLIDTNGCSMFEMTASKNNVFKTSKANLHETKIVCLYAAKLINQGLPATDIGIITPYSLQTLLIQKQCQEMFSRRIFNQLEINSVDGYQGREKQVIIISLVRSNPNGNIGFLSEERRLNVAITRAKNHLAIIGDTGTVTRFSEAFISFIGYCQRNADIESASIYQEKMETIKDLDLSFIETEANKSQKSVKKTIQKLIKTTKREGRKRKRRRGRKNTTEKQLQTTPQPIFHQINIPIKRSLDPNIARSVQNFKNNRQLTQLALPITLNDFQLQKVINMCINLRLTYNIINVIDFDRSVHKQIILYNFRTNY